MEYKKLNNNDGMQMDYFCCKGCSNYIVKAEMVEDFDYFPADKICPLCAIRRGKLTLDQVLEKFA